MELPKEGTSRQPTSSKEAQRSASPRRRAKTGGEGPPWVHRSPSGSPGVQIAIWTMPAWDFASVYKWTNALGKIKEKEVKEKSKTKLHAYRLACTCKYSDTFGKNPWDMLPQGLDCKREYNRCNRLFN